MRPKWQQEFFVEFPQHISAKNLTGILKRAAQELPSSILHTPKKTVIECTALHTPLLLTALRQVEQHEDCCLPLDFA